MHYYKYNNLKIHQEESQDQEHVNAAFRSLFCVCILQRRSCMYYYKQIQSKNIGKCFYFGGERNVLRNVSQHVCIGLVGRIIQ